MVNEVSSGWGDIWSAAIGAVVSIVVAGAGWITAMARYQQRLDSYMEDNDKRITSLEQRVEKMHQENQVYLKEISVKVDKLLDRYVDRAFRGRTP